MAATIKHLKPGDEAVLERVAANVFDGAIDPEYLRTYLREPLQHMIVAVKNGEVVGQIRALHYRHPDKAAELFIDNLGVTPALQRRGIATRLLNAVLALAKELDCQEVWVASEGNNQSAQDFYGSFNTSAEVVVAYTFEV